MWAAIARFCVRRRRWVLAAWMLAFVAGITIGMMVFGRLHDSNGGAGTESVALPVLVIALFFIFRGAQPYEAARPGGSAGAYQPVRVYQIGPAGFSVQVNGKGGAR